VAKGILVRPIERAVLGLGCGWDDEVSVGALVFDVGVVDGGLVVGGVVVVFLCPKSCANLTSFQMPTEEFTRKVDANEVMPAMAWSILGYNFSRIVSDALAVANVAV
jgi:hypothetical protein